MTDPPSSASTYGHDPLCLYAKATYAQGWLYCVTCVLIRGARADERGRCSQQLAESESRVRDVANAACEATVAFAISAEREKIARAIDALADDAVPYDHDLRVAARIARAGGAP